MAQRDIHYVHFCGLGKGEQPVNDAGGMGKVKGKGNGWWQGRGR